MKGFPRLVNSREWIIPGGQLYSSVLSEQWGVPSHLRYAGMQVRSWHSNSSAGHASIDMQEKYKIKNQATIATPFTQLSLYKHIKLKPEKTISSKPSKSKNYSK